MPTVCTAGVKLSAHSADPSGHLTGRFYLRSTNSVCIGFFIPGALYGIMDESQGGHWDEENPNHKTREENDHWANRVD